MCKESLKLWDNAKNVEVISQTRKRWAISEKELNGFTGALRFLLAVGWESHHSGASENAEYRILQNCSMEIWLVDYSLCDEQKWKWDKQGLPFRGSTGELFSLANLANLEFV